MDESSALKELQEAADLISMLEEVTARGTQERLSAATVSGMRITLRKIRENILQGHDTLANGIVNRARGRLDSQVQSSAVPSSTEASKDLVGPAIARPEVSRTTVIADSSTLGAPRRDLRSALENRTPRI